ncbi:hypothetical protein [Alkalinema sp. FACHB-956]|uniref:hypothetical protein n=1 Tax=Alkalinema sp. FACHB-956 TaxID=2692768 RepID=UPI001687B811|nr:hypothetical protein [Alkalinema sp. FACHB-956]MBD2326310.1 hypothetical protein [Alkalinema sp. FACHB-956]
MAVLNCVKPGAKKGQTILLVDLTTSGDSDAVMTTLQRLGYTPEIRHVSYKTGVHVLAVLKDEQHDGIPEDYLIDEWMQLRSEINPDAVHLWYGK